MRNAQFWLERFDHTVGRLYSLQRDYRYLQFRVGNLPSKRMKTFYGLGLNREYDGFKILRRRKAHLQRRLVIFTKLAAVRREAIRLLTTKLPFYLEQLSRLGASPVSSDLSMFQFPVVPQANLLPCPFPIRMHKKRRLELTKRSRSTSTRP